MPALAQGVWPWPVMRVKQKPFTKMNSIKYLPNLTPLRGIAALLTVLFHVNLVLSSFGGQLQDSKTSSFFNHLYLMVDFFFVLSGFIMCYVYAKNFEGPVTVRDFKKFTIARFARVYPLHLFSLLLTTFLLFLLHQWGAKVSLILDAENSGYSFITNLLLLQSMNLHQWFTFNHAAWSISTEWWMYMLFPFLVGPFMKLSKPGRLVIFALCMVGYLVIGYVLVPLVSVPDALSFLKVRPFSLNVAYQFGFFRCMFGFVMGMMLYFGYKEDWGKQLFSSGYTFLVLISGLALCLHFAVPDIFTVLFFPCMLLSAAYGNQNLNTILASKPLQRLGDWSFSIYLIHQPFLYQGAALMANPDKTGIAVPKMGMLNSWLACLIFVVFILFISYLSYRFIEVPARNFINGKCGKQKAYLSLV
jgi:peptidoglycan/LPS O-acetylase OafA/YrhL